MKKLFSLFAALLMVGSMTTQAAKYVKVTSAPADWSGKYILVYEARTDSACVYTGADVANGFVAASISQNAIEGTFNTITIAAAQSGYSVQVNGGSNDGLYICGKNNDNGSTFGTTADIHTITIQNNSIMLTASKGSTIRFNSTSNQRRFRHYKASSVAGQQPVQLYKFQPSETLVSSIKFNQKYDTIQAEFTKQLKYTISPDDAKDQRVSFSSLNESVATVNTTGVVTAIAAGDATIVIEALDSLNKGTHLFDTCYIHVNPITYTTCAEVNVAADKTSLCLNEVTVVYVNGSNIYVKDASGMTLVYMSGSGLKAGDKVSGIKGVVSIYNGLPELKPSNAAKDWTITAGEAPAIAEATAAPVAADVNKVLTWKGVKLTGSFTTGGFQTIKGVFGTDTIAFYNNFKIAQQFDAANDYDITGAVAIYKSTIQVYYISCVENKPMQGAYTIGGEDADFASLYDACEAVKKNMLAGKVVGDVELLIAADLDNQKNVGIFNNTEHTITIRPDKDEPRTITFSATTDANAGPSGAIMIGIKNGTLPHEDAVATQNIIIDGLASETATNKMVITGGVNYHNAGYLVVMYGQVTNSVVRNCVLTNNRTTGSTYAFCFRSQKDGYGPKGAIVENCEMNCIASTSGQGVNYNGANNNALDYPDSCIVRNCIIRVKSRGIFFNGGQNAFIEGNDIYVDGAGGFLVTGIYGNKQKGETHVRNNRFLQLQTANKNAGDYGVTGILASGGGTWEITNNLFTGFELTQDAANGSRIVGIRCGNACTVRHNTFILNELSHHPGNAYKSTNPVACIYAAAAGQTIQNNIFVVNETESNASCYRGALEANTTGNNFFVKVAENSKAVYVDGVSTLATYALLDSAQRADNRNIDPQFTDGYIFESKPAMKVAAIAGITLDIDGNERGTVSVYPGCYEPEEDPTEIEEMVAEEDAPIAKKVMINGHIYIIRGEKMYDMNGMLVK